MQGGEVETGGEVAGELSAGDDPEPGAAAPSAWVGPDRCGVPDDATLEPGTSPIELERGDEPDRQYTGPPVATLPGFKVLPGGCSLVRLEMRGDVAVTERRAPGRLTYVLSKVEVPVRTNRYDLPTEHFDTPVGRIQLVPAEGGAELQVDLRAPAKARASLRSSHRGVVLTVRLRSADVPPSEGPAVGRRHGSAPDPSAPR